jgi:hypothetical protein
LAAKTLEVSAPQGLEGNTTWLKRQLQEAQDTIMQLRKAQRVSGEKKNENTSGSVKQPGINSVRRRGMIGELYLVFSDATQNFDNFLFFVEIFMFLM